MITKKNILLTGTPGSGKTTAIMRAVDSLGLDAAGFYTEEIRDGGTRKGFMIRTLNGGEAPLARVDIEGPPRVGRYGVSISNIESLAVTAVISGSECGIVVIDEIGKMECFSQEFRTAVEKALDSPAVVLGTIAAKGGGFITDVKRRPDVELIELTRSNRSSVPDLVVSKLRDIVACQGER
jgi:nucleoside-triphosphatase